jgi:hypothetical protein
MEKSEIQQKTINLGKLLVKELELEESVDTLGRWMAHHLAAKITEAENAKGKAKDEIEKECADLILKIWSHRWKKTANAKSFHNFEQIFDTLTQLNPRKENAFYFDEMRLQRNDTDQKEEWLGIAADVDKYARICIDFALDLSVSKLTDEEQVEWLQNAPELTGDIDIKIMRSLIDKGERPDFSDEDKNYEVFAKKMSVEKFKSNIIFLENFRKVHLKILKELKSGLEEQTK